MLSKNEILQLPTFVLKNQIDKSCKDLFKATGLSFFEYIKLSPDGKECSFITNCYEGLETSLSQDLYQSSCFALHPDRYETGSYLWSDITNNYENLKNRNRLGYENGVTIIYKTNDACHLFGFSGKAEDLDINALFRYNIGFLKVFGRHFLLENKQLIQESWNTRLPIIQSQNHSPFVQRTDSAITQLKADLINQLKHLNDSNDGCCDKSLISRIKCDVKHIEHKHDEVCSSLDRLTEREKSCLKLVIQGLTSREIASQLGLSFRTVENYIERIKLKLQCPRKGDLIIRYTCLA